VSFGVTVTGCFEWEKWEKNKRWKWWVLVWYSKKMVVLFRWKCEFERWVCVCFWVLFAPLFVFEKENHLRTRVREEG